MFSKRKKWKLKLHVYNRETGFNPHKELNFMQELINIIDAEIKAFQADATLQAEKGNKAAGTRARKSALELTKLFKEFRKVSVE